MIQPQGQEEKGQPPPKDDSEEGAIQEIESGGGGGGGGGGGRRGTKSPSSTSSSNTPGTKGNTEGRIHFEGPGEEDKTGDQLERLEFLSEEDKEDAKNNGQSRGGSDWLYLLTALAASLARRT